MDNPAENYRNTPLGGQKLQKFNTTANIYWVQFQDLEIRNLPYILQSLRYLFSSVIRDLKGIDNFKALWTFVGVALVKILCNKLFLIYLETRWTNKSYVLIKQQLLLRYSTPNYHSLKKASGKFYRIFFLKKKEFRDSRDLVRLTV